MSQSRHWGARKRLTLGYGRRQAMAHHRENLPVCHRRKDKCIPPLQRPGSPIASHQPPKQRKAPLQISCNRGCRLGVVAQAGASISHSFRSRDAPSWRGMHTRCLRPCREAPPSQKITGVELCAHDLRIIYQRRHAASGRAQVRIVLITAGLNRAPFLPVILLAEPRAFTVVGY